MMAGVTMFGCAAQASSRELNDAHRAMDQAYGTPMVRNAPAELTEWVAERKLQLARGELIYIAHQLDFIGRSPDRRPEPDRPG